MFNPLFSKTSTLRFYVWLRNQRGGILRVLFCWLIGWIAYQTIDHTQFDLRYQLRGAQKIRSETILVTLNSSDLRAYDSKLPEVTFTESTELTDGFYWNKELWTELIQKILEQSPQGVGVSFYFGDNVGPVSLSDKEKKVLQDPRILWSASINNSERVLWPLTADFKIDNVGTTEIYRDRDGIVRRILPTLNETTHLISMLSSKKKKTDALAHSGFVINFFGSRESIETVRARDILKGEISKTYLKNKTVIIGADDSEQTFFLTPTGPMTKAEILAQAIETLNTNQVITEISTWFYAFLLLGLLWLIVWIIKELPQGLALFCVIWILVGWSVISLALFDLYHYWLPLAPAWVMITFTWLVYASYQATQIEKRNLELEQEKNYHQEVEQLKTNFISLISHDLKTPIAKIQAVSDRLLVENSNPQISQDLKALRGYSEELYKYIQSILKVSQVESKDFAIKIEVTDFNELIQFAIDQAKPLAIAKSIHIQSHLEPLFAIECDPVLIKEVILNLIENAIKYSAEGTTISLKSFEVNDRVYFEIKDQGQGISPEQKESVWKKFTRGPGEDLKSKGTGLGLYLVKYFVELHGGEVHLESELNKGTLIRFSLLTEY